MAENDDFRGGDHEPNDEWGRPNYFSQHIPGEIPLGDLANISLLADVNHIGNGVQFPTPDGLQAFIQIGTGTDGAGMDYAIYMQTSTNKKMTRIRAVQFHERDALTATIDLEKLREMIAMDEVQEPRERMAGQPADYSSVESTDWSEPTYYRRSPTVLPHNLRRKLGWAGAIQEISAEEAQRVI